MAMGIARKISFLMVTLILVTILAITLTLSPIIGASLRYNALAIQTSPLNDPAQKLSQAMNQLYQDVKVVASSPDVVTLANGANTVENRMASALQFKNYMMNHPDYIQMRYLSINDGMEIVRVDRSANGDIVIVDEDKLQIKRDRDYFRGAAKMKNGEIYISKIELNREYGEVSLPPTPVIRGAIPVVNDQEEIQGIFIINKSMASTLSRFVNITPPPNNFYLTDEQGRFLSHPEPDKGFDFEYGAPSNIKGLFPDFATATESNFAEYNKKYSKGFKLFSVNGYYAQRQKIELSPHDATRFVYAVISTPKNIIEDQVKEVFVSVALITILISLGAFVVAIVFSSYLTKPLKEIELAARKIGSGDYDTPLSTDRTDEIGSLARSIKTMMLSIKNNIIEHQKIAKLEADKYAAEKDSAAKSDFLANMSHELRTPLNSIMGLTKILLAEARLSKEHRGFLEIVDKSSDILLGNVNDILDLSKIEAGALVFEYKPFNIAASLHLFIEQVKSLASQKGLLLEYDLRDLSFLCVIGDEFRLLRILMNLAANAIKYTPIGKIQIDIDLEWIGKNKVRLICAITDTGIGIAPDKIDYIFEKFIQAEDSTERRFGGTGLGLSITKHLTDKMGGKIDVQSELDKGSTFTVAIPFEIAEHQSVRREEAQLTADHLQNIDKLPLANAKILVADDHELNQIFMIKTLSRLGAHNVDVAGDGYEVVEAYKNGSYDLILMDCHMPRLDGYEATHIIRRHEIDNRTEEKIVIISVTADAMVENRSRCVEAGMTDYISKPVDEGMFKQLLSRYFYVEQPRSRAKKSTSTQNKSSDLKPPFNMEIVRKFADNNEDEIKRVLNIFYRKINDDIQALQANITDGDNKSWSEIAHGLKGTAALVEAKKLFRLAKQAQEMRITTLNKRKNLYHKLKDEHAKICKCLESMGVNGESSRKS